MKLTDEDIEKIYEKTNGKCFWCGNTSGKLDIHHIIFRNRVQGGTDHSDNLLLACSYMTGCKAHYHIHNGKYSTDYIQKSYEFLPKNLANCWNGKLKPSKIRIIENDILSELLITTIKR